MTDYPKHKISDQVEVPGGLKDYTQTYQWVYYEPIDEYPDKAALYLNWISEGKKGEEKKVAYRSVYFTHPNHIGQLIKETIWSFLYLKEQKTKPLPEFLATTRRYWLNELFKEITQEVNERWKKKEEIKNRRDGK